MKFSIITPVYNTNEYLDECINSVVNQEYDDFEYILIDDGSDDGSEAICDKWAEKDRRIIAEHQEHSGAATARNRGLDLANGDYILFIDSDDYWIDNKVLKSIYSRISVTKPDVLCFNYKKIFSNKSDGKPYFTTGLSMPTDVSIEKGYKFLSDNHIWGASSCNKVFKASVISSNNIRYTPCSVAEDIEWCFKILLCSDRIDYIRDVFLLYRQHEQSVSKTISTEKIQSILHILSDLDERLAPLVGYKKEVLNDYLGYLVASLMVDISRLDTKYITKELINNVKKLVPLIRYSKNYKSRIIQIMLGLIGVKGTVYLLKILV